MVAMTKLDDIIRSALKVCDLEYVGSEMRTMSSGQMLRIFIDKDGGVTVDDCERASRQVSALLDVEDPFAGQYNLEVSSPGLDRPLFTKEHFERFTGSRVKIKLRAPQEGRRNFVGVIKAINGDDIEVVVDDETYRLAIANIDKANLVPEF